MSPYRWRLLALLGTADGRVTVPLQRQQRWLEADRWGRRQSTTEYFGLLTLGAHGAEGAESRPFRVSFDTGSANVVLPCFQEDQLAQRHSTCDAHTVTLVFGTGEVNGSYAEGAVCVGQLCVDLRIVLGHTFSEHPFKEAPFEGVLGLALPVLAEGSNFSFIDELVKHRQLESNVFAIYFSKEGHAGGELSLGGVDAERMQHELIWVPVSKPGFWQVAVRDLTLDGEDMNLCGPQGSYRACALAPDSGTSAALAAPSWLARRLAEQLAPGESAESCWEMPRLGFRLEVHEDCELQLMAVDVPAPHGPLILLGDPFLRKYYTVYDRERLQIGFALARHSKIICPVNCGSGKGKLSSPQESLQQPSQGFSTQLPSTRSGDRSSLDALSFNVSERRYASANSSGAQVGGGSYNVYFEDHLSRLHADIELTTRKLELEQRRLAKLDKDLAAAESEYTQKRQKYKVMQSSQEDAQASRHKDLLQLERQLDLAIAGFNKLNAHNDGLRAQIDQLRKERQLLDHVFRKMENSIRASRRAIEEANTDITGNRSEHDKMQQRCQALGKALERERKNFQKQTEELKKQINEQNKKAREQELLSRAGSPSAHDGSPGSRRKNFMVADEEEAFSESAMHRRILKVCFLNTIQRRHIKQHMKNIEVFEQAFATIKSSTQISDIEEIVKIFVSLEQRNFSLLTYVNQLNRDIEAIQIQNKELEATINARSPEGIAEAEKSKAAGQEKESREIAEIKQQIQKTQDATAEKDRDVDKLSNDLEQCRPYIWNIVKFLKEEIPGLVEQGYEGDQPSLKVSAPDEHDGQMSHHLMYVEEALMLFRACLGGADARQTVVPAKVPAGGLKKPTDLPSMAHFSLATTTQIDDDDDDDEAGIDQGTWSRTELRHKAIENIRRRRKRQPGPGSKMAGLGDERRVEEGDDSGMKREASLPSKETLAGESQFSKSPSVVGGKDEEAGREEMWWRGAGREKKK
ncbi:unnamed protein product [Durusdinium trenchii]|uniref:Peptidase A1 domain-containing protein n=1 Tax=Durusdinium trenchii TaxID=1381693 RepID=A0ABP0RT76_9DINO